MQVGPMYVWDMGPTLPTVIAMYCVRAAESAECLNFRSRRSKSEVDV